MLENGSDGERIGLPTTAQKHQIMGAGVDASEFTIQPMPPRPPLRLVVAGRLIWSKGVDIAVEAVSRLVREGASVELDIYGSPDPDNP
ncbi:MAG: glycosyltransferase family 1 protein, partial [Alphaproteobacteria bacterium]|nr:glycosyltransferase family 1 protein [Alphaproteobacteria bacterium]